MTLYAVATMWIYGASRIQSDIEFKYKTKFSITFWLTCWKCFPFLALVSFSSIIGSFFNFAFLTFLGDFNCATLRCEINLW